MRSEGWHSMKLGDFVTLQRGYDLPESKRRLGSVPVIGSFGITGYHDTAKAQGPGVTVGRSGASFGVVSYSPVDYWPHNAALYVINFHGNDKRFAYYFLKSLDFKSYNSGSAQPSLNRNYIHQIEIKVPPLLIQRKIAGILSAYDRLIENNTRRINILEEMAQMLYREWFVHFRFPGHEQVKMVDSELGLIPENWQVKKSTDAIWINPQTKVPKEGQKPFVSMRSLSSNSMLINDIEFRSGNSGSKFKNGDTLFARITPCLENGKTGYVKFLPSDNSVAFGSTEFIVLRSKTLCPEYVYLMARSNEFRDNAIKSMSGATGRQRVQEACFDKFLVAHPNPEIIAVFTKLISPYFRNVYILSQKNLNLRRTRDLLLPKLISGEIDVENLNINTGELAA